MHAHGARPVRRSLIAHRQSATFDRVQPQPNGERARKALAGAWEVTGRAGLHEAVIVVTSFLIYFLVRGAVVDRAHFAFDNAERLIDLERATWLHHEQAMQSWVLDRYWLIRSLNFVYFWGHMPLVVGIGVWLWVRHRYEYVLTRNALLASGAIGLVIYWLWPVAPPRLLPDSGLIDTMALYDRVSYNAQETSAFVNPYAAVPSLHFGWSMLLGGVVGWVGRGPLHWAFGVIWPVAMFLSIVMTGNHFILDAVGGAAVSFAGLWIALELDRRWPHIFTRISGRTPARRGGGPPL